MKADLDRAPPLPKAIRGMNDVLPAQMAGIEHMLAMMRPILRAYGYLPIRTPVLESTALFERAVGETSDIVEKEMYTFTDRNGDRLTLRPEGTASCVRMGIEHGLFYHQIQKWWYWGPMYRHERPQKGRYREFYQLGVEAFGLPGYETDAEMIALSYRLLQALGLGDRVHLELNTIGTPASRQAYREALVAYFTPYAEQLDPDSQRRLTRNPLRILDSKDPQTQAIVAGAPDFMAYCDPESREHFACLGTILQQMGIAYTHNPHLVRGLDYYHRTVFEWITPHLGAQATVCAGGRYDGLVAYMGGQLTPGVGFAMGIERLAALVASDLPDPQIDVYVVGITPEARQYLAVAVEQWRVQYPDRIWCYHAADTALKNQLKKAHAQGARYVIIGGLSEGDPTALVAKDLQTGIQSPWTPDQFAAWFANT